MSQDVSDYYEGSRLLAASAAHFGLSVDKFNFVVSQIAALLLASLYRTHLHPSKVKAEIRHGFGLTWALIIGYFCFGIQAIHLAALPAIGYFIIRTQKAEIMQTVILMVSLLYLSLIHIHRQIYDYGSYNLDITGPLMVITQKVTSLAYNLHDGLTRKDEELSKSQQAYAIKKYPTVLEYFSFTLHFPTLMAGPMIFYKDYMDFIDGTNLKSFSDSNISNTDFDQEPSPNRAVYRKVAKAALCAVGFVVFLPMFPIKRAKDADFVETTSITQKFVYLFIATTLVRFKYYFAWTFADAVSNNAGIGYEGVDAAGQAKWDKFTNVNIMKFEVEDRTIKKPFLGGFTDVRNGLEYHHGYTQTGPPKSKVPPEMKNHRDTQTYWYRNRKLDMEYSQATQMSNEEIWIPTITDRIVTAGPYETADEREKRLDIEGKVRIIQRYFRAWKMRKALKELSAEYHKRMRLMQEREERERREDLARKKRDIITKVFPRTAADFSMLYAMTEKWKRNEIARIMSMYCGPAKIAEFYLLLEKEIEILRSIELLRQKLKDDRRVQGEIEFFKTIGDPWTFISSYKNIPVEVDTLETQQGRRYKELYVKLCDDSLGMTERMQMLLELKCATNLKEAIEAWNLGTNRWLRMIVYERVEKNSLIWTYALSAVWHGFYPGYYLTFASGALFTAASRTVRKTIRNYFLANAETKLFYDGITFIVTRLLMTYLTFTFVLLEFWPCIRLYMHMYWCFHLASLFIIFIVPMIIPKTAPNNAISASKSTIAHALLQSGPITNGVSRHHD